MKKRVLIADADAALLREFAGALVPHGFEVLLARDGSKALEASILKAPDIVVIARDCPLIDAARFSSILRSNPRTEHTPLIILTAEPGVSRLPEIVKPLDLPAAIATVLAAAAKLETARALRAGTRDMQGELGALTLGELLQILAAHKKTGVLEVSGGTIAFHEGMPVHADLGRTQGNKALCRLLVHASGHFHFSPGAAPRATTLQGDAESLVIEAQRQNDEWQRLRGELPAEEVWVERGKAEAADDLHAVARELLMLLAVPLTVGELLEQSHATDFAAGQALLHLLEARFVVRREPKVPGAVRMKQTAVLPDQLIAVLRAHVTRLPIGTVSIEEPRVLLVADDPRRLTGLADGLRDIAEFRAEARGTSRFGYGTLGVMTLAEDLGLSLVALPMRRDLLPVALPLAQGAIGVICLRGGAEDASSLADFREAMTHKLGVPWLDVNTAGESTTAADPRAVRGMLAALCRALG